ncbi:hypothetical protein [Methanoregula sp.]
MTVTKITKDWIKEHPGCQRIRFNNRIQYFSEFSFANIRIF